MTLYKKTDSNEYRQDLFSEQEVRLITQASCPIVFLGDMGQKINDFRHTVSDVNCDSKSKCKFPQEISNADKFPTVEWYTTYRLCPLTTCFIEDMTGARMASLRKDVGTITWNTTISAPDTLILCRTNEGVVRMALKYKQAVIRVIAGGRIAAQLKAASLSGSYKGMGGLAKKLQKDGQLGSMVKMLTDKEIDLKELSSSNVFAVCCVFQSKGHEQNHIAIGKCILDHAREETLSKSTDRTERNVLMVSLSRHLLSLTLLYDIPEPVVSVEPVVSMVNAKVQTMLDLSTFKYVPKP